MKHLIQRLGEIGTGDLTDYDARRVRLTNYTALIDILITSGYVAFYLTRGWYAPVYFNFTISILWTFFRF